MQDKFEQHIKSRLENHTEVPPPFAWDNIEKALHEEKPKTSVWSRWVGVAAAILVPALISMGVYWFTTSPVSISNETNITQVDKEDSLESIEKNSSPTSTQDVTNYEVKPSITQTDNLENYHNPSMPSHTTKNVVKDFLHSWLNIDAGSNLENEDKGIAERTESSNLLQAISNIFLPSGSSEISEPNLYAFHIPEATSSVQIEAFNATNIKETEDVIKSNNKNIFDRVEISPYGGVAMLNSFEQPSLIAPEFNDLAIDNSVVTSYGSNASYRINDRWKIRSGVGVMNINQDTYDVPMKLSDSDDKNAYNTQRYTNLSIDFSEANQVNNMYADMESNTTSFRKDITHEVQYIEVPVEMEYQLTQGKKLNLAATGGLSTLILNKNDVYLKEMNEVVAKATNLKSVSFSANAGVKVDYNITEKVSINVEPQLKYMMNTVTANDEVQPYLLAVNAGISYAL